MGTLSVRENLHFSAALRLPSRMTHAERKERVEKVIDELGLRDCASTKVSVSVVHQGFVYVVFSGHIFEQHDKKTFLAARPT